MPASLARADADSEKAIDLDLVWLGRLLIRRALGVFVILCASLLLATGYLAVAERSYSASAVIVIEPQAPGLFRPGSIFGAKLIDQPMIQSQVAVLSSSRLAETVISETGLLQDEAFMQAARAKARAAGAQPDLALALEEFARNLSVERVGVSNTIKVTLTLPEARKAAEVTNALAAQYVGLQLPDKSSDQQLMALVGRIVVSPASPPSRPSSPSKTTVYGIALLIGLMFGMSYALTRGTRRDKLISRQRLESATGVPCFTEISPARRTDPFLWPVPASSSFTTCHMTSVTEGRYADQLRQLAVPLREVASGSTHIIGITTTDASTAEPLFVVSVAAVLARGGLRTLLMDCNLRCEGLSSAFDPEQPGISDILNNRSTIEGTICTEPGTNLSIIPAGRCGTEHESDLLGSPAMRALLLEGAQRFDCVLVAMPSLGATLPARCIGSMVDGVLLIVSTKVREIELAHMLRATGLEAKLIGTVLKGRR